MIILTQIQKELSKAIKNSGLTQSEIARRLGVKHTQISCYVHAKKMPALDTFANLCMILDVDPADILCTNAQDEAGAKTYNNYGIHNGNVKF